MVVTAPRVEENLWIVWKVLFTLRENGRNWPMSFDVARETK